MIVNASLVDIVVIEIVGDCLHYKLDMEVGFPWLP
jgi:hypothetical protein